MAVIQDDQPFILQGSGKLQFVFFQHLESAAVDENVAASGFDYGSQFAALLLSGSLSQLKPASRMQFVHQLQRLLLDLLRTVVLGLCFSWLLWAWQTYCVSHLDHSGSISAGILFDLSGG